MIGIVVRVEFKYLAFELVDGIVETIDDAIGSVADDAGEEVLDLFAFPEIVGGDRCELLLLLILVDKFLYFI